MVSFDYAAMRTLKAHKAFKNGKSINEILSYARAAETAGHYVFSRYYQDVARKMEVIAKEREKQNKKEETMINITPDNAKEGDHVRSVLAGWGEITDIGNRKFDVKFPHKTKTFFSDGRHHPEDEEPEIVEFKKHEKPWEPEGGDFLIDTSGWVIRANPSLTDYPPRKEGRMYPTIEAAKKAHELIRPFQRLVAYILEHDPNYELNNPDNTKIVEWNDLIGRYDIATFVNSASRSFSIMLINLSMSEDLAQKLADDLNAGRVKL